MQKIYTELTKQNMKADPLPLVAGTLQTDPRSGGIKRSSGVNVLPIVAESKFYRSTICPNYYFSIFVTGTHQSLSRIIQAGHKSETRETYL